MSLDGIRPTPAKAEGHKSDSVRLADSDGPTLGEIAWDALVAHCGGVKQAADAMGEKDPSFAKREVLAGKFYRLEKLKKAAKSAIASAQLEAFGPMDTPIARGLHAVAQVEKWAREVRQCLEFIA